MAKERPRQQESSRERERLLQQEERSIATLGQITQRFADDMTKVLDSFKGTVDTFSKAQTEAIKENKKGGKTRSKTPKGETESKGIRDFETKAGKLGYDRLNKFTTDVFGKKSAQRMTKGLAKFTGFIGKNGGKGAAGAGTKGLGKGGVGKAIGGLGSLAGGLMRAAGPVGAILGVGKAIFDFWDGGGFAKMKVGFKMLTGNKMTGAEDIASVEKSLEGTEEMRKLNAEYNYKVPMQLRQQAADDMFDYQKGLETDKLQYDQSLVKDKLDYELGLRRDALQFQQQQAMETLDAELDKRKAIAASGMNFIKNYSNISERALKAIGSSTKQILEGVTKFQAVFGGGVKESFKLSENAQGLAYHFGAGAEDVLNMTNLFRLMGKTSAETAENLIGGITAFADLNDLAPQAIFAQIKDAGEDIYKFSNGTAENFVKQASLLTKMSVSMSQMMKASDTMVLNYKDSIKAEMGLSAMLGKNINLSEVRAKLMSNDQAGAASALKSALGGVDVGAMNPFAKQQLMQATGMDISAIMGIQQGKEGDVKGPLTENAKAGKAFADGALQQDIANAGAKLALEQQQRKKLLEFEQNQRLVMLQMEQAQRLDGIFLEQKYRALAAEKGYKKAKEEMAVDLIAKQAENFALNLASGTASSLNAQGLTNAAQMEPFITSIQGVDTSLTDLISSGAVKGTDMRLADYLTKKLDIISTAGKKIGTGKNAVVQTPDVIAKKLQEALAKSFGSEVKMLDDAKKAQSEAKAKAVQRQIDIANALADDKANYRAKDGKYGQTNLDVFRQKNNVTAEEIAQANKLIYREMGKNEYGVEYVKDLKAVNQEAVNQLLKANDIGLQTKVAEGANKPLIAEVKGNNAKTIEAQNQVVLQQQRTLSESEYNTKIQLEQVALTGLSLQMLNRIMENTARGGDITLNGTKINNTLLNQSRRFYGVGRTEKVA